MSVKIIRIIAANEMKTLLRSWFFRIFVMLTIIGLGFFNVAMNLTASGAPWVYRALASSVPYVNLIILNLGQAIVAIFLASEFLKQDRKNDTVEVIYAHSMTNSDYIFGKTLGILSVFFILNLIVLFMGTGFSFLGDSQSRNIFTFLAYPLLISLPTLVFILGLSFFMMVLLKNQAITFIILLGFIALTVFELNRKAYHLFDFIAYQVPMTYTPLGGFGSLSEILLHRSIFFVAGISFIFFTVYKLERLPQSKYFASLPLFIALGFFLLSGGLMYGYYHLKQGNYNFKREVIDLNNFYSDFPRATVTRCQISLEHKENQMMVFSVSDVKNELQQPLDTLLFSLNPSLQIESLKVNGKDNVYNRELHLIKIPLEQALDPGDSLQVTMGYRGKIDERVCFPDQKESQDNFRLEVFNVRKRFAFLESNFVCLTSECLWYPATSSGYSTKKLFYQPQNFTKFSLKVKTFSGLVPVSQGNVHVSKDGTYEFFPEYPVPQISLLIGPYVRYHQKVDSVDYCLYAFKDNISFKTYFNEIADTLPGLIRDLKHGYENKIQFSYPFKRFSLIEVPLHFALDIHEWSVASDAVQPEMILFPEKGVLLQSSDFKVLKYRKERQSKRKNQEVQPKDLQIDMFKEFISVNFMGQASDWYTFREIINNNTYSLFPEYVSFITQMRSDKWPFLNLSFQAYLNGRISQESTKGTSRNEKIILELKKSSLQELFTKKIPASDNVEDNISVKDIVVAKGIDLFNILGARIGKEKVDSVLSTVIQQNRYHGFTYNNFSNLYRSILNESPDSFINQWYSRKKLPGYLIQNAAVTKVLEGDYTKYQVQFKISNPEMVDGFVSVHCEDYHNDLFMPARSARQVSFALGKVPVGMLINTYLSENLPQNIFHKFSGDVVTKRIKSVNQIEVVPLQEEDQNSEEIIVDNEDSGFALNRYEKQAFLKSLVYRRKESGWDYSFYAYWHPPENWEPFLSPECYGRYVRSACYIKSGTGEKKALWTASLPNHGFYEVSFYYPVLETWWGRRGKLTDYNLLVYHDGGTERITIRSDELSQGWNVLGTYYISSGKAKVELTNKSNGDLLIADAVKWTKSK